MQIIKYIPNSITSLNLVSGCIASVMALQGNLYGAMVWIFLAAVFDFFDGFAARMLKAYSPIGKELDSLADMVSFGVAPGMILYRLLETSIQSASLGSYGVIIPFLAFVIPLFSGLRLAKFNIDDRQSTSFLGLPVPAHALFWASIGYEVRLLPSSYGILFAVVAVILALGSSLLLVSELPMFSLKVKSLFWKGNELRYLLLFAAILFVCLWGFLGVAGTIVLYIILSLFSKNRR